MIRGLMFAGLFALSFSALADLDSGKSAYKSGDYSTALVELLPLAVGGDPTAQALLGEMYDEGRGVQQNYAEAYKWSQRAAQQGSEKAQNALGIMYSSGHGVPQDYAEAMKWYVMAARQGDTLAQINVGSMYAKGQGVQQDYAQAMKWYVMAANLGSRFAQYDLAVMYEQGLGVSQNYVEAYKRYALAKAYTPPENVDIQYLANAMSELGAKMTQAQVAQAQHEASTALAENQRKTP